MTKIQWKLRRDPELVPPHREQEARLGDLRLQANEFSWRVFDAGGVQLDEGVVERHHVDRLSRKRGRAVSAEELARETCEARARLLIERRQSAPGSS